MKPGERKNSAVPTVGDLFYNRPACTCHFQPTPSQPRVLSSLISHPSSLILHPSSFILFLSMGKEFHQAVWNEELEQDWLRILALAVREDLGSLGECTTDALVPEQAMGRAAVAVRQAGVLAGEAAISATLSGPSHRGARILPPWSGLEWLSQAQDGQALAPRQAIGILRGPARAILA